MRRRTTLFLGAALAAAATALQDPPPPAVPPPAARIAPGDDARVVVRVGDETVTLGDYKEFLVEAYGLGPLRDLVHLRLLRNEAERRGVMLSEAEIEALVDATWQQILEVRHKGNAAAMLEELAQQGHDRATFRAFWRLQHLREELPARIVRATREPSEDRVRERFEREYGAGGVKVVVRHLLLNAAVLRAELAREGAEPSRLTDEALARELLARADSLLAELETGAPFEALARRESHDRSAGQNGGLIPAYNYDRYGPELAAAVRAAEVGVPSGPVVAQNRVHLFVVESRVETNLEDVRAEVTAAVMAEDPTWEELRDLDERLRRETPVEYL